MRPKAPAPPPIPISAGSQRAFHFKSRVAADQEGLIAMAMPPATTKGIMKETPFMQVLVEAGALGGTLFLELGDLVRQIDGWHRRSAHSTPGRSGRLHLSGRR